MKKRPKKLKLALETLRILTPSGLEAAVGGLSAATNCFTCLGTCRSDCGSCGANCTHQPCPETNALTCLCG
jgi:hypothetical protein